MTQEHRMGTRAMAATVGMLLAAAVLPGTAHAVAAPVTEDRSATEGLLTPGTASGSMSAMSLIPWYTSPSLATLRREVDSLWPARSRVSDGTIGDVRHSRTVNSHNPVGATYGPRVGTRGAVHAMDITASGIDVGRLLSALIGDSRLWYVIHDGKIWSRTTNWAPRPTWGDPHRSHLHINLREDSQSAAVAAERDTRPWLTGKASTTPAFQASPGSASSLTTDQVRALQRSLIEKGFAIPAGATGFYGAQTTRAVAAFQRAQGWTGSGADGLPGPETLRRLGVSMTSATPVSTNTPKPAKKTTSNPAAVSLSKSQTRKLQKQLIKRGYAIPAGATGFYGAQTTRAVAAFQRAQGWRGSQADGLPGPETLRRLGVTATKSTKVKQSPAPQPTPSAKPTTSAPGSTSAGLSKAQTTRLQKQLIKRGYAIPAGATGFYGAQTTRAMAAFQRAQGWRGRQADGLPGPETLRRLGVATSGATKAAANRAPTSAKAPQATAAVSVSLSKRKTRKLQKRLIKRGYQIPSGATGWYGPETTRAVAAFQRAQGWRGSGADGAAGPLTLKRLGL